MKNIVVIVLILRVLVNECYAYPPWIYNTSFPTGGIGGTTFYNRKNLEKYLTSFGFTSEHFVLWKDSNQGLIYRANDVHFQGIKHAISYGINAIDDNLSCGERATTEQKAVTNCLSYCNRLYSSCKLTPTGPWKFQFSGDGINVFMQRPYIVSYDEKSKAVTAWSDTSWACKPPRPDKIHLFHYGVTSNNGTCYLNNSSDQDFYTTTVAKRSTVSCGGIGNDEICLCNHYKDDYLSDSPIDALKVATIDKDNNSVSFGWANIAPAMCESFDSGQMDKLALYIISADRKYKWGNNHHETACINNDIKKHPGSYAWVIAYNRDGCTVGGGVPVQSMSQVDYSVFPAGATIILNTSNATPVSYDVTDSTCETVADPVSVSAGTLNETFIDYNDRGIYPLYLIRHYISAKPAHMRIFGGYWSSNLDAHADIDKVNNLIHIYEPQGLTYEFQMYTGYNNDYQAVNNFNAKLSKGSSNNYKLVLPSGSAQIFNAAGRLIIEQDPTGHIHHLAYDNGHLTSISDQFHHTLTLSYDSNGLVSSLVTPAKHTILYNYDKQNRLTSIIYPDQTKETYLYQDQNDPNLLTSIINRDGVTISTWKYNNDGQVVENLISN